jgi:hypothetical protein
MPDPQITPDLRVSRILSEHPETYDVFIRYGCPDMRRGFFAFMARIMKLSWAARVHRIPISDLVASLNSCMKDRR